MRSPIHRPVPRMNCHMPVARDRLTATFEYPGFNETEVDQVRRQPRRLETGPNHGLVDRQPAEPDGHARARRATEEIDVIPDPFVLGVGREREGTGARVSQRVERIGVLGGRRIARSLGLVELLQDRGVGHGVLGQPHLEQGIGGSALYDGSGWMGIQPDSTTWMVVAALSGRSSGLTERDRPLRDAGGAQTVKEDRQVW